MKIKFVLAGGGITKNNEGRDFLAETIKGFKEPVKILDCLFAREEKDWKTLFEEDKNFYSERVDKKVILELASENKFAKQVKRNDVISVRGGSTNKLLNVLKKDMSWKKFLDGKTIAGTSAGADAFAKYYSDIDHNKVGEGLCFLNIKIIVHWKSDYGSGKIDWNKSLKELEEYGGKLPLYKLREGEFVVLNSEKII